MSRVPALVLAFLLASLAPSRASPALIGYADSLSAQSASGWACLPGSGVAAGIAAYAGTSLLGVFPAAGARPDLGNLCGGGTAHGFALWFDQPTRAQFLGQSWLSLYAIANGQAPLLLAASTPRTINPALLPQGRLAGLDGMGDAVGTVSGFAALQLFAGAPEGDGGTLWGGAASVAGATSLRAFAVAPGNAAPGPLYAYATTPSGALVPLQGALPRDSSGFPATQVLLSNRAAQSGARSGITNTLYTSWMPPGMGFAGLSGTVSMAGNSNSFSEGLITLGTTADDEAACASLNATWPQTPPPMARLWAAILKTNAGSPGASSVGVPVNVALPFAVPPPGAQGACLMILVSAGYPYLDAATARYVTTTVSLQASLLPGTTNAAVVLPLGLGGEFSFATGSAQTLTTYVGIKASRMMAVDGIAGSVSASAVVGAPAGSSWQPVPASFWTMDTEFVTMPAPVCASAGFSVQPSNGTYAVMRRATAAPFTMPPGSRIVMSVPVSSTGVTAIQRSAFQGFAPPPAAPGLVLGVGDCLVAFHSMISPPALAHGMTDYENQSTVYLRLIQ